MVEVNVDPAWKGAYRAGGLLLITAGIVLLVTLLSFFILQPQFGDPIFLLENPLVIVVTITLFLASNILWIPGVPSLYLALKDVKKTHMLMATVLAGVGLILIIASIRLYFSLFTLSDAYKAAVTEAEKVTYVVATSLVEEALGLVSSLGSLLFSVAIIIISLVMLSGIFSKGVAYLGTITGTVGIIAWGIPEGTLPEPLWMALVIISLFLLIAWSIVVGAKLYKLGEEGSKN